MKSVGTHAAARSASKAVAEKLRDFAAGPRVLFIMAIAAIAAVIASVIGVVMFRLIQLITNLCYFGVAEFKYIPFGQTKLGWTAALIPIAGSIIVAFMIRYGTDQIRGHGIPEAMESILFGHSKLDVKVAVLKPTSAVIVIGTGGPFGAEGPIIMTGGAIGSLLAQALPVTDTERKILLVAGACAGMTIVFGTPVAAIMLGLELMLFEWSARSILPVATACIVANVLRHYSGLEFPLFPFVGGITVSPAQIGAWILVGLCGGLLSDVLTRMVYAVEDGFRRLPVHLMWWPAIGSIAVGIGGLIDPNALGLGYANIRELLHGDFTTGMGITLLVVKAIIWSIALGSGTSGGTLAPLMMMGGAAAAAAVGFLPHAAPGFWALLGMSAVLGGTLRLPFTAIFFAIGVTGNNNVLFPLVVTCMSSYAIEVLIRRRDILTEKIARHGIHISREWHVDEFALTQVGSVMVRDVQTVPAAMTLHQVSRLLSDRTTHHPSFPVMDTTNHVLGIVNPPRVIGWRQAGEHRDMTLGKLLEAAPPPTISYPDEYLDAIAQRMTEQNLAHMPVVSREDKTLVGYIGWRDLLKVRAKMHEEETRRVVFRHRSRSMGTPSIR